MRTTLKHDRHRHILILRKFSEDIAYSCGLCRNPKPEPELLSGKIDNQAYCCEDCNFFIHKWCAESPQQIHHPSHPHHPLSLDINSFHYECGESGCDEYTCDKKYKLEAVSAIATLPPKDEETNRDTYQELEFFGHDHPLNFFHVKIPTEIKCQVCDHNIRGCSVYGCRACLFLIHESCAQLPRQIENHPLHPQHLLNLIVGEGQRYLSYIDCQLCDKYHSKKASYICSECNPRFVLHVNCALASSTPPLDLVKLDHPLHADHKLISGYLKGGHNGVRCRICSGLIKSGEVYGCTKKDDNELSRWFCSFFIHKTCAELPWKPHKLKHPFLPNGDLMNLILRDEDEVKGPSCYSGYIRCYACGEKIDGVPYYNYDDDFNMHAGCAIGTLSAIVKGGATAKVEHFAEDDLFFTCNYMPKTYGNGRERICLACQKSIEGLGYFCYKRYDFLHKSCAEELKPVLEHPFHPQHPLLIQSSEEIQGIFFCKGCNSDCETKYRHNYYYSCGACEFHLDLKCAVRKPTLKYPCHQHDLAYFEHVKYMRCNACGYICNNDLYRCVECNFNVHLDCLSLPSVVEDNECHLHPLTLCDKVPDQDCGVCRRETNPRHGAYYCEECSFVAHIKCAIFKGVKPKHSKSLKKKISKVKRELENLQKEIQIQASILNAFESMKIDQEEAFEEEGFSEEDSCRSSDYSLDD